MISDDNRIQNDTRQQVVITLEGRKLKFTLGFSMNSLIGFRRTPLSSYPGTSTRPSYSPGTSRSAQNLGKAECSNCKFLAEKIKTLEAKIKILEGALEMERHPEKHTLESAAILHELYNDMGKLDDDFVYTQNAAATKNAKLIGALPKFVGPDVKAFLSHVKPALLSAVEAL
ncbi:hypothetical protein Tco_1437172 [Tanacetum coccineum]